jgi:DNA replication protein DnaC
MKFSAMAAAFEQQLKEPKSYSQLGFEERFGLMVDAEWNRRQDNKLRRRVRDARLDISSASMEGIEYIPDRGLDKQQLLRLSTCAYIEEGHNVILKGASGSGKTYLACALGYAACTKFKKVRYVRMPELLDELFCAHTDNLLKKVSRSYAQVDLLILDEWLLRALTVQQAFDLLEIIEARTKHGATIFCTQYPCMTDTHCCLRHRRMSRLPLYALTRLTGFTLSHYGSHTSLPTLKPNLTIAAPRLCTDCLPGFVGTGVSPTYTAHTELAHLLRCRYPPMGKSRIIVPLFSPTVKVWGEAILPLG